MKFVLTLLLCSFASEFASCQKWLTKGDDIFAVFDSKLDFADFKVPVYKGRKAKFDINSSSTARLYRTSLQEGYRTRGVNFGGHYTLVQWGCGSPCKGGAIIDLRSGKVYDIPSSGIGWDFKPDSRLLIVNPPGSIDSTDSTLYYIANRPYEVPEIYIFNETTKKFKLYKRWPYKE